MNVPWLSKKAISDAAADLLELYESKTGQLAAPPTPVEAIIEKGLGLSIGFGDINTELGTKDVIGALYVKKRLIVIDNSLLENKQEGRLSFTYAHEIGHWVLHRKLVQTAHRVDDRASILCRDIENSQPLEWQANCFGSCLLMPENLVRKAFTRLYGASPLEIHNFDSAFCGPLGFDPCVANWPLIAEAAISIGGFTNVSRQAMIIRLQQLGLVQNLSGVKMSWATLKA